MKPEFQLDKKQIKRHIIIWFIIIAYLNFDAPVHGPWSAKIIGGAVESLNYIFVFYAMNLIIIPEFWVKQRPFLLILFTLFCYSLYALVTYINYLWIIQYFGGYSLNQDKPISKLLIKDVFYFFVVTLASAASFFYRYSIQYYKIQSEKEKLVLLKELNFLKNQFNSHITFNFFNYCYSKIHRILPNIAESIGLFSDSLRHALKSNPAERILLNDEIKQINNFIDLQRLLNVNINVAFSMEGNSIDKYIYPRILITIVESTFVFGISDDSQIPIQIKLRVDNAKLYLTVIYKQKFNIKISDFRSDLKFVIQTLNLYYSKNFSLKQEIKDNLYCYELMLVMTDLSVIATGSPKPNENKDEDKIMPKNSLDLTALMHLNKQQVGRHILVWILFITYGCIYSPYTCPLSSTILIKALINLNSMFVFYSVRLFIFPKFWEARKYRLAASIFVILIIYWINVYSIFKVIMPTLGVVVNIADYTLPHFLKERFYYFAIFSSAGVFAFFSRYGLYKIKQQEQKEKMLLGKELYYLKNQFNSPLTFDFLNYCSENIHKHSPETADSIRLFSDMLHYTLQTMPEEKVPISKEINYINNFISIQKLLSEKVYVEFNHHGEINDKKILSRILVTFVENAFKHGLYNNPEYPIQIDLMVVNNVLLFTMKNRINPSKRVESTRKGIENVTQILDLYYADKYSLKKEIADEEFSLELSMEIDQ